MRQDLLSPAAGSRIASASAVKTAAAWHIFRQRLQGQKSRAGNKVRPGFEGGQLPLISVFRGSGLTNIFRIEYEVVNTGSLNVSRPAARLRPINWLGRNH